MGVPVMGDLGDNKPKPGDLGTGPRLNVRWAGMEITVCRWPSSVICVVVVALPAAGRSGTTILGGAGFTLFFVDLEDFLLNSPQSPPRYFLSSALPWSLWVGKGSGGGGGGGGVLRRDSFILKRASRSRSFASLILVFSSSSWASGWLNISLRILEAFESTRNLFGRISCRIWMSVKFPDDAVPVVTAGEMGGSNRPRPSGGCKPWSLLLEVLSTGRCWPLAPLTLPLPLLGAGTDVMVVTNARKRMLCDMFLFSCWSAFLVFAAFRRLRALTDPRKVFYANGSKQTDDACAKVQDQDGRSSCGVRRRKI